MFGRRDDYTAPQAARVAFGAVLLAGAAVMVAKGRLHMSTEDAQTPGVIAWTWLVAAVAAAKTYAIASYLPPAGRRDRLLHLSLVVPAAGLALVLPLTLHLLWFQIVDHSVAGFDDWVGISILFAGFAHVVFALLASLRASQLARGVPAIPVSTIYFACVAAGSLPFPVVPSIIIALTGLPILPLLLAMKPLAAREREAPAPLPRAIARPVRSA